MSGTQWPEIGDAVWWTNSRGGKLRGVCEVVIDGVVVGVRMENRNYYVVNVSDCEPRDL